MRIGELADAAGTTAKTLRFYEDQGLLPPAGRTPSGYRNYTAETIARIDFIHRGQAAGLTLAQIKQILDIRDYKVATHLVLATRDGKIKKTFLSEYDTNRQGGIIAIRLRGQDEEDGDELVSALLVDDTDDIPADAGPAQAWNAGADGRSVLDPMCTAAPHLLAEGGTMLIVHSECSNAEQTVTALRSEGLAADIVAQQRALAQTSDLLDQLQGRRAGGKGPARAERASTAGRLWAGRGVDGQG